MKRTKLLLIILCLTLLSNFSATVFAQKSKSPRQTINFNREWKYARGDYKGAELFNFNDQDWETIGLPHSFSIPYFMSKDFYTGYGWYRKPLTLSSKDLTKTVLLEFDGVFQEAEIFVNGKLCDTHLGGYTGFFVDISAAVKQGVNLIAVRVNNQWKSDFAPRAGEHVFSGGIYRNVRLVIKEPVSIDWYGVFVTTPDLEKNNGQSSAVNIKTDICNRSDKTSNFRLKTEVIDSKGKIVASAETTRELVTGMKVQIAQTTTPVYAPRLWHPQHPALYKVISSLYNGKKLLDRDETSFGFRWFKWTADKGFYLNGEHIYLKGANVHQDHAGWGDAVTETAMKRDVRMMKDAGFDFIRGSHYPHSPAFSRACDEEGMLFWSEAPFWGIGGFKPDGYWDSSAYPVAGKDIKGFEESALKQLAEMIHIHRNHPSIVAWSMSNEPFFSAPETKEGVRRLLKKMVTLCHSIDSTRPAAVGGVQRPLGKDRLDLLGDIAGYNGDGSSIPDFQNPGIPNIISEYGSTTADRPGEYEPGWGDLTKDDAWKGRPWRSGQAIWCGFDHGSIAGSQLGKMGIVDYFRIPKRAWFWYRNEYRQIAPPEWPSEGVPVRIKLEATKTADIRADGTDDVMLLVSILDKSGKEISNSPSVTLSLASGPGEFPTGTSITFDDKSDIRIADGKAAIEFRSYYSGVAVVKATSPGLEPTQVEMRFVDAPAYVKGKTAVVKERPYTRFTKNQAIVVVQTFGPNNPTFASSSMLEHAAGHAADGDESTWWQPKKEDAQPYWTLDTEKGLTLQTIHIRFPEEGIYHFLVEASGDNIHWSTLRDCMKNTSAMKTCDLKVDDTSKFRFVRVRFNQENATGIPGISEVEVKGIVRD